MDRAKEIIRSTALLALCAFYMIGGALFAAVLSIGLGADKLHQGIVFGVALIGLPVIANWLVPD